MPCLPVETGSILFFQPTVIEKRKPLSQAAKRAGWVGCNILLDQIADIGKIKLIDNSIEVDRNTVQTIWQKTLFLRDKNEIESRGWLLDILKCVEMLGLEQFSLQQIYSFKEYLSERHPNNRHITDKIRQQLQVLRDKGMVEFRSRGNYGLVKE